MFWFNPQDPRALFVDNRRETCHADTRQGRRQIVVDPDILADFRALPFSDDTFSLVVFDPPHTFAGPRGWTAKKYGTLKADWREVIRAGFAECFRVLRPLGTLIFKWNEHRVPVSTVLALTPERPLFGQRCGATAKTHWIVFMKTAENPAELPWRCFHCNEVFRDAQAAEEHFGQSMCATPACQIDADQLRSLETELARYRSEDTDLHRQIAKLQTDHQTALMRAEEEGYSKGLHDGRAVAESENKGAI
jgi:SAM-dependent methyltransferase